VAKNSFSADPN